MGQKADARQAFTLEVLPQSVLHERESLRRLLVRKSILSNDEVLEEIKVVRGEMEGRQRG